MGTEPVDVLKELLRVGAAEEGLGCVLDKLAELLGDSTWYYVVGWSELSQMRLLLKGGRDGELHQARPKPKYEGCHPKNTLGLFGELHWGKGPVQDSERGRCWVLLKPQFEGFTQIRPATWGVVEVVRDEEYAVKSVTLVPHSSSRDMVVTLGIAPGEVLSHLSMALKREADQREFKAARSRVLATGVGLLSEALAKLQPKS